MILKLKLRLWFCTLIAVWGVQCCSAQDTTMYVDPYFKIVLNKQKWEYLPFGNIESSFKTSLYNSNIKGIFNDAHWRLRGLKESKLYWNVNVYDKDMDVDDSYDVTRTLAPWVAEQPSRVYQNYKIEVRTYDIQKYIDVAPDNTDQDLFSIKHYPPYDFWCKAILMKDNYELSFKVLGYQKDSSFLLIELRSILDQVMYVSPEEIDKAYQLPDVQMINARLLSDKKQQGIKYFEDFPNTFKKSKNYLLEYFYRSMVKQLTLDLLSPVMKNEASVDDVVSKWLEKTVQDSLNFNFYIDSLYMDLSALKSKSIADQYINIANSGITCDDIVSGKHIDEVIKLGNQYIVELYDKYNIDSLADYNFNDKKNYLNVLPVIYPKDFSYNKYYAYADSISRGLMEDEFYLGKSDKGEIYNFLNNEDKISNISLYTAENSGFQKYLLRKLTKLDFKPNHVNIIYGDNPFTDNSYYHRDNKINDIINRARVAVDIADGTTEDAEDEEEEEIEYFVASTAKAHPYYPFYPNMDYYLNYLHMDKNNQVTHNFTKLDLQDLRDTVDLAMHKVYFDKKALGNKQANLVRLFRIERLEDNYRYDTDREFVPFEKFLVFYDVKKSIEYKSLSYPSDMNEQFYCIMVGSGLESDGCGSEAKIELDAGEATISNIKLMPERLKKIEEVRDKLKSEKELESQNMKIELPDPFDFSKFKSYEEYYTSLTSMNSRSYRYLYDLSNDKINAIENLMEEENKNIPPQLRLYQSEPTIEDLDLDGNLEIYIVSISNGSIRYSEALTIKDNKVQPFSHSNLNDLIYKTNLTREMIKRSLENYEPAMGRIDIDY